MEERKETIPLVIKGEDELKQMEKQNEYLRLDIENQFNEFISVTMKKINESNNIKQDYGRSVLPAITKNVGGYIQGMHNIQLEREKFEWAKTVWKTERTENTQIGFNPEKQLSEGVQINFLVNGPAEKQSNDTVRIVEQDKKQLP